MSMIALGAYIYELRKLRGLTQQQVADAAKVSDTSVRTWEQGKHEPSASDIDALITLLGGAWDDVTELLRSDDGEAVGKHLAAWRFNHPTPSEEERRLMSQLASLTGERRQTAILVLRQLLAAEERQ